MQDNNFEENIKNDEEGSYEMEWKHVKSFQHRYIVNFPKTVKKHPKIHCELPYPILNPTNLLNFKCHKEIFYSNQKPTTCLDYYKKLYIQNPKSVVLSKLKANKNILLPQYVIDVVQGEFDNHDEKMWYYNGGVLDYFIINDISFIVRADINCQVHVTQLNKPNKSVTIILEKETPIYGLKCNTENEDVFLIVRQKCDITIFHFYLHNNKLKFDPIWKLDTNKNSLFACASLNEFVDTNISIIDDVHKFKAINFVENKVMFEYNFSPKDINLSDCFAQINNVDTNTVLYMNRSCISLLDLRSNSIQNLNLKKGFQCDDLCVFSKINNQQSLIVSSVHNVINLDLRFLKCISKVAHLMSTPPFISNVVENDGSEHICLLGEHYNDKFIIPNYLNSLNTPQCVPSIKETIKQVALTTKLRNWDHIEEQLLLPVIGMKSCKDNINNETVIYTSNIAGDIFKQRVFQNNYSSNVSNSVIEWTDKLTFFPKTVEATSICNLNDLRYAICARFPKEKNLTSFIKNHNSQNFVTNMYRDLKKHLQGTVGDAMNSIWIDENISVDEIVDSVSVPSSHKVSEWLDSMQ